MQLRALLNAAIVRLERAGVETPRLDAEVILSYMLGQDRSWLFAHNYDIMSIELVDQFERLIQRRVEREPTAYIIGQRDFFGLTFEVTPAVLIPRPETELLVEQALQRLGEVKQMPSTRLRIVDVGTGSGCIAVTLAVRLPWANLLATDLSATALLVARRNAQRHQVADRIQFIHTDLLAGITGPVDLIVSNPPYIAQNELPELAPEINRFEPLSALTDGGNGLAVIERLLAASAGRLQAGGTILVEIGADQGPAILALAEVYLPESDLTLVKDLAGHDRLLMGRMRMDGSTKIERLRQ
jgi:release factor glutamine methyltransferase